MPALLNTFLFVEPQLHYLNYGSAVLHDVVTQNAQFGQSVTELIGDQANPDTVKQELETRLPMVVCVLGHGNVSTLTVECTKVLVTTESPELALFKDKVISLCSCLTAVYLGPAMIDVGALAYTGYKQEFWFYIGDEAGKTHAVRSPFEAEFQFVASLMQGKTTAEARQDQLRKYDLEIDYWILGDGKNNTDAMELARILEMNKSNSVFLGEGTVRPSPTLMESVLKPLAIFGASLVTVAALVYREMTAK